MRRRLLSLLPSRVAVLLALVVLLARRALATRAGLVLVYHRIGPVAGSPERELVPAVAASDFRAQLAWLQRFYRLVPAGGILDAAGARRRWQPYPVALTFDDDLPAHLEWVLPALRSARVPPATFFLSGASLDGPVTFWWDRLQAAADAELPVERVVPGADIHAMGRAMEAWPRARREAASAALADLGADPPPGRLTAEDVRELARDQDIGFHTLHHDRLTCLSDADLAGALADGRDRLESETGQAIDLLAYPYGAAGDRESRAARAAGFRLAFTTAVASCRPETDAFRIGRAEPGPVPLGVFALKVERALGRRG